MGKSTLAARFAELHAGRFSPVWWVTADSVPAIDAGLADLAVAVNPDTADLPSEQRVEHALRWLAGHTGWLLVLDNLTTPADAGRLLHRVRTGTILITSRQSVGWREVTTVALDVMTPGEAGQLLERVVRSDWPEADLTGADELCAALGWLPLAVEQAGAYLAQARITPTTYLDLLRHHPTRMFTATAEGGDPQRAVAQVWRITLDHLSDTPLAGRVLRHLAWHAPDRIPRTLITAAFPDEPAPDLTHALGRLAAYSMITLTADTITVHRLVQALTRTPDPSDPHRHPDDITHARDTTVTTLAHTLTDTDPELPADWPLFQAMLPHVRALLDHTHPDTDTDPHCLLADHLGRYLRNQGDPTTAITLHTRAAQGNERLHGRDHPDTLGSRNNLASAYETAGDLGRAIPLYEATLTDGKRILGPDHPTTNAIRSNLDRAKSA